MAVMAVAVKWLVKGTPFMLPLSVILIRETHRGLLTRMATASHPSRKI
jgi:hypothetical protein